MTVYPYQCYRDAVVPMNGLGLPKWLTPPKAVREAVSNLFKSATVRVSTPAGPVDLSPQDAAAALKSARVTVGAQQPPPSSAGEAITRSVESIPGGWLTVGAGVLVGALVLPKLLGGRR